MHVNMAAAKQQALVVAGAMLGAHASCASRTLPQWSPTISSDGQVWHVQALADLSQALSCVDLSPDGRATLLLRRGAVAESLELLDQSADDFIQAMRLDATSSQVSFIQLIF